MNKHNFKIGDKVKLRDPHGWSMGDSIGIIIRFTSPYIRVDWEGGERWKQSYPHLPKEIEYVVKVSQQLVFDFMD